MSFEHVGTPAPNGGELNKIWRRGCGIAGGKETPAGGPVLIHRHSPDWCLFVRLGRQRARGLCRGNVRRPAAPPVVVACVCAKGTLATGFRRSRRASGQRDTDFGEYIPPNSGGEVTPQRSALRRPRRAGDSWPPIADATNRPTRLVGQNFPIAKHQLPTDPLSVSGWSCAALITQLFCQCAVVDKGNDDHAVDNSYARGDAPAVFDGASPS
jgi:hypothetical protein